MRSETTSFSLNEWLTTPEIIQLATDGRRSLSDRISCQYVEYQWTTKVTFHSFYFSKRSRSNASNERSATDVQ
jgi:hypothetical protein